MRTRLNTDLKNNSKNTIQLTMTSVKPYRIYRRSSSAVDMMVSMIIIRYLEAIHGRLLVVTNCSKVIQTLTVVENSSSIRDALIESLV